MFSTWDRRSGFRTVGRSAQHRQRQDTGVPTHPAAALPSFPLPSVGSRPTCGCQTLVQAPRRSPRRTKIEELASDGCSAAGTYDPSSPNYGASVYALCGDQELDVVAQGWVEGEVEAQIDDSAVSWNSSRGPVGRDPGAGPARQWSVSRDSASSALGRPQTRSGAAPHHRRSRPRLRLPPAPAVCMPWWSSGPGTHHWAACSFGPVRRRRRTPWRAACCTTPTPIGGP